MGSREEEQGGRLTVRLYGSSCVGSGGKHTQFGDGLFFKLGLLERNS